MTDLNPPRYTNGVTRNTIQNWLKLAEEKRDIGDWFNISGLTVVSLYCQIIDLCMSWLDIEQQLTELKRRQSELPGAMLDVALSAFEKGAMKKS